MRRRASREREGFTLIEIIVVLAVVAALTAILAPNVVRYVEDARVSRARSDVRVVGSSISQFFRDVGRGPAFSSSSTFDSRSPDLTTLFGPGTSPAIPSATGWPTSGGTFDETASGTDAIADQLIANDGDIYPTSAPDSRTGQGLFWRGPYIDAVDSDPWGQRYLVALGSFGTATNTAAFVISAGSDGEVQTAGDQPRQGDLTVAGDDILFRVR